ncbi:MAG: DNA-binding protein, partial [Treponemataceae bacterium]|nr:DNA-binding protein [Treponemataceae bacterium]
LQKAAEREAKEKRIAAKKAAKEAKYGRGGDDKKLVYRKKGDYERDPNDGIKRTGKVIHIVSKREKPTEEF